MNIETRVDSKRGCGWRKPGGLYLISGGVSQPCGILPIPLTKCPTCSCGIKPNRGWTWIEPAALIAGKKCASQPDYCASCSIPRMTGKHGLLWIGGSFYAKPADWTQEAIRQGVSRRLGAIPNDFKLGETWVLVAHREVTRVGCTDCRGTGKDQAPDMSGANAAALSIVLDGLPACKPCKGTGSVPQAGIFHAFIPTAIEYVVKGTDEQLEKMAKRGITPVKVLRDDNLPLTDDSEEDVTLVED